MDSKVSLQKSRPRKDSTVPEQEGVSEREKLLKLVHIWRSKYEKINTLYKGTDDVIQGLKKEIEQIKAEKETVSKNLLDRLASERAASDAKIAELQMIADTAAKKAELESRDLRTKLHRLKTEIKPIIDMYKERDKQMNQQVVEFKQLNEKLRLQVEGLDTKIEAGEEGHLAEISELKRSHRKKLLATKIQYAKRMEQMKEDKEETKKENELKLEENTRKSIQLTASQTQTELDEMRQKIAKMDEGRKQAAEYFSNEMTKLKRKAELTRIKLRHKEQKVRELRLTMRDANLQLLHNRASSDVMRKTSLGVKDLARQLVVAIREARSIEQALTRINSTRRQSFDKGFIEVDDVLKLEILYTAKVSEISRLKKLIHDGLIETIYKPTTKSLQRHKATIVTPPIINDDEDDELVLLRSGYGSDRETTYSTPDHDLWQRGRVDVVRDAWDGSNRTDDGFQSRSSIRGKTSSKGSSPSITTGQFDLEKGFRLPDVTEQSDRTSWMVMPKNYSEMNIR